MRRVIKRIVFPLAGILFTVMVVENAAATCNVARMSNAVLPAPVTLNVPRDTTAGKILYDTGWESTGPGDVTCQGGEAWTMGIPGGIAGTGLPGVYQSGIPGLGIKVAYSNGGTGLPSSLDNVDNKSTFILKSPIAQQCNVGGWPGGTGCLLWSTRYTPTGYFRMQYIALGTPITTGVSSLPSPIGQVFYGGLLVNQASFSNTQFVVNVITCRVLNNNIQVNLKSVRASDFNGAGSRLAGTPFSIPLQSDDGVSVSYEFDGTRPAGVAATNVLANTAAGANVASGVGIALYKGDTSSSEILPIGQSIFYEKSTFQGEMINIPATAWYYQNSSEKPRGGLVQSVATVTLNYQ